MTLIARLVPRTSVFAPFRFGAYRYLWLGSAVTMTTHLMQQVAQGWLVYDLTDSPIWLGLVGFARGLPMLVLSLPLGVLIDRLDRRRLLVSTQALTAGVAISLAILIATGLIEPWQIVLTAFLSGTLMAIIFPTRQTLIPATVDREHLGAAVALGSAGQNAGRIVGPSLAGVLIAGFGLAVCFVIQAIGLLLAALVTLRLPRQPGASQARQASASQNLIEGLRFVRRDRPIRTLMLLALVPAFVTMPFIQFLPIFARDILHAGPDGLGLLMGASGLGSVIAAVIVAGMPLRRQGLLLFGSLAIFGGLLAALALSRSLFLSVVIMGLIGAAQAVYMATSNTMIHFASPDNLRGRVMSAYMTAWGLMPLGTLPQGALADLVGAPAAVAAAGLLTIVFVVAIAVRVPPFDVESTHAGEVAQTVPAGIPTVRPEPELVPDKYDRT